MKAFLKRLDGNGGYKESERLPDVDDNAAYTVALAMYPNDEEYVESCLDGRGWIHLQTPEGLLTYQQDSL